MAVAGQLLLFYILLVQYKACYPEWIGNIAVNLFIVITRLMKLLVSQNILPMQQEAN
jgi:hypothetical protein